MAHEMLNSFTPVSSLASTIKSLTESREGNIISESKIDEGIISDINLAAKTIKRRSDGLLKFVDDYRKITNIPMPNLQEENIDKFLSQVCNLMESELNSKNIKLIKESIPVTASLNIDTDLLEQVYINLISNSTYALEGCLNPEIRLGCKVEANRTLMTITDNGKGIHPEILKKIYIPFFTTRKNGSGIGLSLSKNIIRLLKGSVKVESRIDYGTSFILEFSNNFSYLDFS